MSLHYLKGLYSKDIRSFLYIINPEIKMSQIIAVYLLLDTSIINQLEKVIADNTLYNAFNNIGEIFPQQITSNIIANIPSGNSRNLNDVAIYIENLTEKEKNGLYNILTTIHENRYNDKFIS